MTLDKSDKLSVLMRYVSCTSTHPPSLLQKTAMIVGTAVVAGVAIMFSAVIFAVLLVVGTAAGVYLWWKTRALRRQVEAQMRQFQAQNVTRENTAFGGEVFEGEIIEGEAIRVDTDRHTP